VPELISSATRIPVPGGKLIDEYIGRVNSADSAISIAHMRSPAGWSEPGQRPDFDEYTFVIGGGMHVEFEGGSFDAGPGQAIVSKRGEWIRYSTPAGAEYVAICTPAFTLDAAHRDPS
jgi:ethanolamine utilization protein EutQ (cupin superfamily)